MITISLEAAKTLYRICDAIQIKGAAMKLAVGAAQAELAVKLEAGLQAKPQDEPALEVPVEADD